MKKYFLFFLIIILVMIIRMKKSGHLIYGDGNGYFAYAHAIYFEKSLNFKPIIEYYQNFQYHGQKINRVSWRLEKTKENMHANPWTIGTAIFWLPSLFIIDIFTKIFQLQVGKFSIIYEIGPFLTGAMLNLIGIFFLEKYLLNFFKKRIVKLTVFCLIFGTNVLFYTFFEPALSHQPSFFLLSLLLYWSLNFKSTELSYSIFGVLSGLLIITRLTNSILLLPIFFLIFKKNRQTKYFLFSFIGLIIGVLPQIITQGIIYGPFYTNPYLSGANGTWSFNFINLVKSLFGAKNGVFYWHILYLIGIAGLIKTKSIKSYIFFVTFILLWIIVSSWSGIEGAGFGGRMFYESLIYLSYGIAGIFNRFSNKKLITIVSGLCLWNFYVLINFLFK